ncbi:uncharacterized protein LOC130785016 isoform X2 [Actinidia eriantha]|uniref:uncharacterized protein LOC130785016 isoform X2 n=1 Tax=Actinidia eriantha TaxID=165200 RepID=UPI0025906313|nr:uncharacterized protein LOC130785016 isoform X2 [Actinidia eriantha]XP_057501001.1 uncharacterized protein LOC130785016 isoform X2 [Actinidia eriantha]
MPNWNNLSVIGAFWSTNYRDLCAYLVMSGSYSHLQKTTKERCFLDLFKCYAAQCRRYCFFSGRTFFFGSRNSEPYFGWLAEHKFERNTEFTGSILKGNWLKNGKKQVVFDGNRRNTYKQSIYYHIVVWASVGIWSFENSSSFCCKSENCHLEGCLEEDRTVIACWNQLWSWMDWRKCSVPKAIGNS